MFFRILFLAIKAKTKKVKKPLAKTNLTMEARSHGGIRTRELLRPNQNQSKTIMNNERVVNGAGPPKNRNNAVEINMTGVGEGDTSYCGSFASCLIFTFSVFILLYLYLFCYYPKHI